MSEVVRVQVTFEDMELAMQALEELHARGELLNWQTAAQYQMEHHTQPVASSYFHHHGRGTTRDKANPLFARNGEKVAIVVMNTYGDLAGLAAEATEHGPAGQLIGGIHILDAKEGEESETEKQLQADMKVFRVAYSNQMVKRVANHAVSKLGATATFAKNRCVIRINGSRMPG